MLCFIRIMNLGLAALAPRFLATLRVLVAMRPRPYPIGLAGTTLEGHESSYPSVRRPKGLCFPADRDKWPFSHGQAVFLKARISTG